jgi:hypothetical protein
MILRFSIQSDSPYSQIFRKAGQKKAEPNRPIGGWRYLHDDLEQQQQDDGAARVLNGEKTGRRFFGEGRGGDSTWPEAEGADG